MRKLNIYAEVKPSRRVWLSKIKKSVSFVGSENKGLSCVSTEDQNKTQICGPCVTVGRVWCVWGAVKNER